jgi:hypothetical protein
MPDSLAVASISKVGGVSDVAVSLPAAEAAVEAAAEEGAWLGADGEVAAALELGLPPVPLEHATSAMERAAATMGLRMLRLWAK